MDEALLKRFNDAAGPASGSGTKTLPIHTEFVDDSTGEIVLVNGDQGEPYVLKPLTELYGAGGGSSATADPQDESYMPLFLGIEEEIARFDTARQRLKDADVALALRQLSMNPEGTTTDALALAIQNGLRLILSLNDYSRQEVRQAIRKIGKSVDRHSEGGRNRGYVEFIQEFFGRKL